MLDGAAVPVVRALVEDDGRLAASERLAAQVATILNNTCEDVAKVLLAALQQDLLNLPVDECRRPRHDLGRLLAARQAVLRVVERRQLGTCLTARINFILSVEVYDFFLLARLATLLQGLRSSQIPQLLDRPVLLVGRVGVADGHGQAAQAVLLGLCLLAQDVVEPEAALGVHLLHERRVVSVLLLAPLLLRRQLVHEEHLLQLLTAVGDLRRLRLHECKSKRLERLYVRELGILLEEVRSFLAAEQCLVLQVQHLLSAIHVEHCDLVSVLLGLGDDACLVDEGERCQARHLSDLVLGRVHAGDKYLEETLVIPPRYVPVAEVDLFVELARGHGQVRRLGDALLLAS